MGLSDLLGLYLFKSFFNKYIINDKPSDIYMDYIWFKIYKSMHLLTNCDAISSNVAEIKFFS